MERGRIQGPSTGYRSNRSYTGLVIFVIVLQISQQSISLLCLHPLKFGAEFKRNLQLQGSRLFLVCRHAVFTWIFLKSPCGVVGFCGSSAHPTSFFAIRSEQRTVAAVPVQRACCHY